MKKLTIKEFQNKLNLIRLKEKLTVISYDGDDKDCEVICEKCKTKYIKKAGYFVDKRKISICKNCFPTQPNCLKEKYVPREGYSLIGKYNGMQNKTLIKHNKCGFIWSIKPNNLENGKGCPKCNKKVSKGEQRITNYLLENSIQYETQKKIEIQGHHLTIDFYLTDFDLYIEYNGEQHYNPIAFFGGIDKYNTQIFYDNLKQHTLKDKLIVISYLDFNNIESILKSSTTIPNGSTL